MKKILLILVVLQSFLAYISSAKAEALDINKPCGIVTEDIFRNAKQYLGQSKSIKNNPYQYFLFLKTGSKNVNSECIVLVNFEFKLTEYIDQNKNQDFREKRVCRENTSLLVKPESLKAHLYEFVHQKLDDCLLD